MLDHGCHPSADLPWLTELAEAPPYSQRKPRTSISAVVSLSPFRLRSHVLTPQPSKLIPCPVAFINPLPMRLSISPREDLQAPPRVTTKIWEMFTGVVPCLTVTVLRFCFQTHPWPVSLGSLGPLPNRVVAQDHDLSLSVFVKPLSA